jgi:hypothetical protein
MHPPPGSATFPVAFVIATFVVGGLVAAVIIYLGVTGQIGTGIP